MLNTIYLLTSLLFCLAAHDVNQNVAGLKIDSLGTIQQRHLIELDSEFKKEVLDKIGQEGTNGTMILTLIVSALTLFVTILTTVMSNKTSIRNQIRGKEYDLLFKKYDLLTEGTLSKSQELRSQLSIFYSKSIILWDKYRTIKQMRLNPNEQERRLLEQKPLIIELQSLFKSMEFLLFELDFETSSIDKSFSNQYLIKDLKIEDFDSEVFLLKLKTYSDIIKKAIKTRIEKDVEQFKSEAEKLKG